VIDPATNTAYLTHKTYASGTAGPARWYMDAVDMATGTEKPGFPVELAGAAQNQPGQTFRPTTELQRPGLLLMNGAVYAAFGSSCDTAPWQGWVFGVSTAGQVTARWVAVPTGNGAGIWQSGAGITSDGSGTLLVSTGNTGAPSTPTPGKSPPASLGESVVRLNVQPDGSLKAVDFFAPFEASQLGTWDADFASGGVTGLNEQYFGTVGVPHLAVAVGKDGYVYLLNRDELGGIMQGPGGSDKVVQRIGPYGGVWSRPGVWPGDGGWVYIPTASGGNSAGGSAGYLRVYQYGVSGTGSPTLSLQGTSPDAFGFGSSAPVITSDGTNSGSALVWTVWTPNGSGAGAQLRAYDPIPMNGQPVLCWSAPIGTSAKFALPGVGAGRLYVGTRDGKVLGFGSPVTPLLTGSATTFPATNLSNSVQRTLTLTATNALTLTKLTSSSSQFTIGTPTPALPATLSAGQTIQVPITFTPSQTGLIGGTLAAETNQGTVSFAMSGTGQAAGPQLESTPPVVSFGGTTVGGHLAAAATFRNVGGAPLTINAIKLPAAPFGATGLPPIGGTIAAGASITVNLTFDPTQAGSFSGEISMETSGGNKAIGLSGSAGSAGALQITSETNEFGPVAVGTTANRTFTVTNTGGTTVTITKSKPPSGGAFAATTTLSEGTTLAPGASATETVAFTPTAPGYANGVWMLNGNDSTGLHEVDLQRHRHRSRPGRGVVSQRLGDDHRRGAAHDARDGEQGRIGVLHHAAGQPSPRGPVRPDDRRRKRRRRPDPRVRRREQGDGGRSRRLRRRPRVLGDPGHRGGVRHVQELSQPVEQLRGDQRRHRSVHRPAALAGHGNGRTEPAPGPSPRQGRSPERRAHGVDRRHPGAQQLGHAAPARAARLHRRHGRADRRAPRGKRRRDRRRGAQRPGACVVAGGVGCGCSGGFFPGGCAGGVQRVVSVEFHDGCAWQWGFCFAGVDGGAGGCCVHGLGGAAGGCGLEGERVGEWCGSGFGVLGWVVERAGVRAGGGHGHCSVHEHLYAAERSVDPGSLGGGLAVERDGGAGFG
jgi:hypothetical protein